MTFAVGAPVVLALGVVTALHAGDFRDPRTLWMDTLAKNPESWMAHNNLGVLLKEDGNADGAITHYLKSLRLNPDFPEAHTNLGGALAGKGLFDEAVGRSGPEQPARGRGGAGPGEARRATTQRVP